MSYEQIVYQPGVVARVILNRPEYRNALSRILLEEVDAAFAEAAADESVRVVVLSGNGPAFSAGNDMGSPPELADRERRPPPPPDDLRGQFLRAKEASDRLARLRNIPKPTVAMVSGYCLVMGWTLANSMDLIFAAEDARFLAGNTQHPTLYDGPVGARRAKEILFEGRLLTAQEALDLGIVNRVFAAEELEKETLAFAEKVAEKDPWVLAVTKSSINRSLDAAGYTQSLVEVEREIHAMGGMARPNRRQEIRNQTQPAAAQRESRRATR